MTRPKPSWLPYDGFKLAVALILLLLLFVFRGAPPVVPVTPTPQPPTLAAPTDTPEATLPPPVTITLDEPPPSAELAAGPNTFVGTASGGAIVRVLSNGEPQGESPLSTAGQWRVETELPEGRHVVVAQALDTAGNVLAETNPQAFIVNPVAAVLPAPVILRPMPGDTLRAGPVTFSGTTAPGTTVVMNSGGGLLASAEVDASGAWTAVIELPQGELTVLAIATHPATGQSAESLPLTLTVLPAAVSGDTEPGEPAPPPGPCGVGHITRAGYVVAPCENLTRISERLGVTLGALLAANPQILDPDLIYPGQILIIP
ncbi:MAG: LysM peptidoglycan-binding domain-containing protein [Chloroflexi bacterium]|nr:LysM peptidoglycan-binding domain-containing protein [Chloroflexota bacterium]